MKSVHKQVWDNLDAQLWTQVMYQVGKDGVYVNQVWDQVYAQVRDQVRVQVMDQVYGQVWNQVHNQVSHEISS